MIDNWNRNLAEAPKDGTELIFWISTDKGFEDQTANFEYHVGNHRSLKEGWYWSGSGEPLKRPDLVKGWMLYPQPPKEKE